MDFVVGLPRMQKSYDSLWLVVDWLTMSSSFIPVKSSYSDRGAQFTSTFWRSFQKGFGTKLKLSTAFHSQTDGKFEHTIQSLEDNIRACIIDFKGNWD